MKCFIHLNDESVAYCNICKRPICKYCANIASSTCPRCNNFNHNTIYKYNLRLIKWLIPFTIIRLMLVWDFCVYFYSKINIKDYYLIVIILAFFIIPLLLYQINYGFKNGLKYNIIGKKDAIVIADNKKERTTLNTIISILFNLALVILMPISYIVLTIFDIIHLVNAIKDLFKHKKLIIDETAIRNKEGMKC